MKKIIIIGASSGIGRELAISFAKAGCQVGITGRRNELMLETKKFFPDRITTSCFDITGNDSSVHIHQLIKELGGLDIFIYSAGIAFLKKQPDWDTDHRVIETNVVALTRSTGLVFNYFAEKGEGQIVVISSIAAVRGGKSSPVYNASKAFQSNLVEGLNLQAYNLDRRIIITEVQPGFVDTAMAKGDGKFWVMPVEKVAKKIIKAITAKKRKVIVTNRWKLAAFIIRNMPFTWLRFLTKNKT